MYHPYFRGKQFELIAIRESAQKLSDASFTPIIEPVREQFSGLKKALDSVSEANGSAIVVVNPLKGDLVEEEEKIVQFLHDNYAGNDQIRYGLIVHDDMTMARVSDSFDSFNGSPSDLIHFGFSEPKTLGAFAREQSIVCNVFQDGFTGKLYQRNFKDCEKRILLRDGFEKRRNRDHPESPEFFSDLHITFEDEGMNGFGDFLVVGSEYQESGGPAYTIAIHLTFIDPSQDDAMYVQHFKSDRQDTPKDPAGKFAEALAKLIAALDSPNNKYFESKAISEFRQLHANEHYPGLGYLKKLSMQHHIETLADFLGD